MIKGERKDYIEENDKKEIMNKLEELLERMEGIRISEYIELVRSPKRMLFINFLSGLARGLGFAIGATVLGAVFLIVLLNIAQMNIPVIAEFVARIIKIVETYL
ncbi:DUF5665 domain-containing protein [Natronospora cellulosivora (SeqCode)]